MSERSIDDALVKQALTGDKEAFDLLVLKYQRRIAAVIARIVSDPNVVMDIAQETFIRAYRALASFQGNSAFYTWIYRIAINSAKNHLKTLGRRPRLAKLTQLDSEFIPGRFRLKDYSTPESLLECEEVETAVLEAMNQLPEVLRTSIMLREMAGLSYDEIADAMSVPVGTVRSRIFRARLSVDEHIKPYLS